MAAHFGSCRIGLGAMMAWIALVLPTASSAETQRSFDVSATVEAGCAVDGVGSSGDAGVIGQLDFGTDSALSTATHLASIEAAQTIRLRCTPGVSLSMAIDGGGHVEAGTRTLQRGGDSVNRLPYTLYSDAGFNNAIAIGGQNSVAVTASNQEDVRLPIYAQLALPGNRPAGTYTDTLLVTLSW